MKYLVKRNGFYLDGKSGLTNHISEAKLYTHEQALSCVKFARGEGGVGVVDLNDVRRLMTEDLKWKKEDAIKKQVISDIEEKRKKESDIKLTLINEIELTR